ncbi:MAG: S8 family serine peptidase, partial [bacterium]|nr:S8 family serine peptidase [bacterium]
GNIATAKGYIFNAIMGGILLLSAYVILYTINPELVGGEFNLKGIDVPASQATEVTNVIATNEIGAASAINAGCTISLDTRDFTALECESDIASGLNLSVDPVITTDDTSINNQTGTTTIQSGGNRGAGRKIVILDTGYNYKHPELSSSYLGGKDFINNDSDPMDDHTTGTGAPGHGSHVAGIITADGIDSRSLGIAPQAGIIAGKILDKSGNGTWSRMTDAIYWAVNGSDGIFGTADDFKADVINLSVGGGSYTGMCDTLNETTRLFAKAVQYAKDNGVLVVVSSGNVSGSISMPGCINASFTVGAVDGSDKIAAFSGRGSMIDIVAPGVNVYSSLLGNNYGTKSGTSMATPVVSGIAALIKTTNPSLTVSELEQKITSTACDLGPAGKDTTFGWGRINATSGNCTPPPSTQIPNTNGRLSVSPTSCTKGVLANNQNCNITVSYTINGIATASSLTLKKNSNFLQTIQCNGGGQCNGQVSDLNPSAGVHRYTLELLNNISLQSSAYIYTNGGITSDTGSCSKLSNSSNPNCDITLLITAPGVSSSVIITKDGTNWRVVPCTNPQCTASIIDINPTIGTHTYTIRDASDNTGGKLSRVTVVISPPSSSIPTCSVQSNETLELCTGTNYTGTCAQFSCNERTNFNGSPINGQIINSARITRTGSGESDARLFICDTGWVHPYTTQTEPVHCMWKDINSTTQAADIWNPNARDWCYWDWVGSSGVQTCGQPPPGPSVLIVPGATIMIRSYGSL